MRGSSDSSERRDTAIKEDRVVVGIPTYNEEVAIGSVVASAKKYADEVIVVDDGSTDRTTEIANEVGATASVTRRTPARVGHLGYSMNRGW